MTQVTLVGKRACHLCDEARLVIDQVCAELGVPWSESFIDDDPVLYDRYWEQVPVTLIDGVQHDYWRVDEARFREALTDKRT